MKIVRFRDSSGYERKGTKTSDGLKTGGKTYSYEEVDFLHPSNPTKIICLYMNYRKHQKRAVTKFQKIFQKDLNYFSNLRILW